MRRFLVLLALVALCRADCEPLESLLRIQFDGSPRTDAKGFPCVIRLGVPPEGLDPGYWDRVKCERDFENGALTSWRCRPWRAVPSRYRVEYHVVCKDKEGDPYDPEIPTLVADAEGPAALPSTDGVFCSLRYRVRYKELWSASAYLTAIFIFVSLSAFGVLCFFYNGAAAVGLSSALLLLNVLLNATCYECLNHLDYVGDGVVVAMMVARVVVFFASIIGLLVYLENDRLIQGFREMDLEEADGGSETEYATTTDISSESDTPKPPVVRRRVGDPDLVTTLVMEPPADGDPEEVDPYDGGDEALAGDGDDGGSGNNKED